MIIHSKSVKKANKFLLFLKWIGIILMILLVMISLNYENIVIYRLKKQIGEIEIIESKSEIAGKNLYLQIENYPRVFFSYPLQYSTGYSNHQLMQSIHVCKLFYDEIETLLEDYFGDQEVVFQFGCGISSFQRNEEIDLLDANKEMIEQLCNIDAHQC